VQLAEALSEVHAIVAVPEQSVTHAHPCCVVHPYAALRTAHAKTVPLHWKLELS
jgi:hypothetical protein